MINTNTPVTGWSLKRSSSCSGFASNHVVGKSLIFVFIRGEGGCDHKFLLRFPISGAEFQLLCFPEHTTGSRGDKFVFNWVQDLEKKVVNVLTRLPLHRSLPPSLTSFTVSLRVHKRVTKFLSPAVTYGYRRVPADPLHSFMSVLKILYGWTVIRWDRLYKRDRLGGGGVAMHRTSRWSHASRSIKVLHPGYRSRASAYKVVVSGPDMTSQKLKWLDPAISSVFACSPRVCAC